MVRSVISNLMNQYGSEDDKMTRKNLFLTIVCLLFMYIFIFNTLPKFFVIYFSYVESSIIINAISTYFFRKRKNAEKFKIIKIISYIATLIITLILLLPAILIFVFVDFFADTTNTLYLLKKHPCCFVVEMVYHIGFGVAVIQQTILYAENFLMLLITYIIFLAGDVILCALFRLFFIHGKNKYYEKYRYQQEMDIISEYIFLGTTTISILYSASNYSYIFIPILLWYSLKQIKKYRKENKCSSIINTFLVDILLKLQEIDTLYLGSSINEDIVINEYIDESKRIKYYMEFNDKRKIYHFLSRKHVKVALKSIENLILKKYKIPKEKEQAHNDIEEVMNNIARCII